MMGYYFDLVMTCFWKKAKREYNFQYYHSGKKVSEQVEILYDSNSITRFLVSLYPKQKCRIAFQPEICQHVVNQVGLNRRPSFVKMTNAFVYSTNIMHEEAVRVFLLSLTLSITLCNFWNYSCYDVHVIKLTYWQYC